MVGEKSRNFVDVRNLIDSLKNYYADSDVKDVTTIT